MEELKPVAPEATFSVAHQKVELDINFSGQITGKTEITVYPDAPNLQVIRLHSRQCQVNKVTVNGLAPAWVHHEDPCAQMSLHGDADVHQWHILADKIAGSTSCPPAENLLIGKPSRLLIKPVDSAEVHQASGTIKVPHLDPAGAEIAQKTNELSDTSVARFTPLVVVIEFEARHVREGLQIVTGRGRWPHLYTHSRPGLSSMSSLFPCIDRLNSRCTWDISIKCAKTVRDALRQVSGGVTDQPHDRDDSSPAPSYFNNEMQIICAGELTDEIVDKVDATKKIVSFACSQQLSAQQLGFAVGPFEQIPLAEFRDAHDAEELGRNAVEMFAYCLPGRADEVKNTCLPTPNAIDFIVRKYIACPFRTYCMVFVEDAEVRPSVYAGLSLCSTKLLYPENVFDTAQETTRSLVHAIVSQWIGINVIGEEPQDTWVIVGCAYYITEMFMRELCGNNEFRFRMKQQSDLICERDYERPSIYDLGAYLHVDPSEYEFLALKAPLVLFILDRRIAKSAGASKMPAIIAKILTRARTGDLANNCLSTDFFQRTVEKFFHARIDDFLLQWVKGAGAPSFHITQRFNKKKLVVEMAIKQVQATKIMERERDKVLDPNSFMRDAREDNHEVYAAPAQNVFTGPMTIRIHEADGTPYEHIVEIKSDNTVVEVPYNTKYKRLKRNKRQKNKGSQRANAEVVEEENDALVYCLGDVLQSEQDINDWQVTDWSPEDEERMSAESYEWIRVDADFEWICALQITLPGYMFSSQLQQDRDVVAQYSSIQHIGMYPATPLISSILLRTMMDRRYFHGIRSAAALGLVKQARMENNANMIGLFHLKKAFNELYCVPDQGSYMTRPNDFSDQLSYFLQGSIIEALSRVRDENGHAPQEVKEFLLDKLKFNDNSANDFSDAFYVAKLMKALCIAVAARPSRPSQAMDMDMDMDFEVAMADMHKVEQDCLAEIDRYRRMDEWTSSYQNLYSRTALECQSMLVDAGVVKFSPLHFLQYTRPGNYDMLRLAAYNTLVKPEVFENPSILRYVLRCIVADSSSWIRQNLREALGRALAVRAIFGKREEVNKSQDDIVVEDDAAAEARQKLLHRRQNFWGAVDALKAELSENQALMQHIWHAICYEHIELEDLQALLDFCKLLYDPVNKLVVTLVQPRYWKVENIGQAKLKFTRTNHVRTKKLEKWVPKPKEPQRPPGGRASLPGIKLKLGLGSVNPVRSPTATPTPPSTTPLNTYPPPLRPPQPSQPQAKKITLKFGGLKQT